MRIPPFAFAAGLCLLLSAASPALAAPDPIMDICLPGSCSEVITMLAPCGGGATNSSLQQDLIYTPTASLGGCQCNHLFYNYFSTCLACITSRGKNKPEILNQQDWVEDCEGFGFNYTNAPVTTPGSGNSSSNNDSDSGLSTGAIVGIAVGAVALVALVGACFFIRSRRKKSDKSTKFEQSSTEVGAGTAATAAAATATSASYNNNDNSNYHNQDYPTNYERQDDYYANHQSYGDSPVQQYQSDYTGQQPYQSNQFQDNNYSTDGQGINNNSMVMQNLNHNTGGSSDYVPPQPHPASTLNAAAGIAAASAGAAAYSSTSPRQSDTFSQSLRSKPKNWDSPNRDQQQQQQQQQESVLAAGLDHSQYNDKMEYDDGEVLEPPRSRDRFVNDRDDFVTRRSMTPPRANMQSYREEMQRNSVEREPRISASDRGSVSNLNPVRGADSSYNLHDDDEGLGRASQDSPDGARRRARAAELFSGR